MFTILLHSSKTMRQRSISHSAQLPACIQQATELGNYLKSLEVSELAHAMKISNKKALEVRALIAKWTPVNKGIPAIDAFLGDIYSGLQVRSFTQADRDYANHALYILSGLYGVLRALDSIQPYRLEMGYTLPKEPYKNLYTFWNSTIAAQLPTGRTIINLSAVEYTKAVFPHLDTSRRCITPKFLTRQKNKEATFVVVHAKVARGAFAHWLITHRVELESDLSDFNELGYQYDAALSTSEQPVFVCDTFGGIGLSVRLS